MMIFWDTVRGHQLTDTLIRELPKLQKELKRANDLKEKELAHNEDSSDTRIQNT